uniref:Uncharacterized protein n=1 Tax=Cucumis melo TaxID=3656 RepID=A0A9I9CD57_CUCME
PRLVYYLPANEGGGDSRTTHEEGGAAGGRDRDGRRTRSCLRPKEIGDGGGAGAVGNEGED